MTALEVLIAQLKESRTEALKGDAKAVLRFGNLLLASWSTVLHALEELNRRRIA